MSLLTIALSLVLLPICVRPNVRREERFTACIPINGANSAKYRNHAKLNPSCFITSGAESKQCEKWTTWAPCTRLNNVPIDSPADKGADSTAKATFVNRNLAQSVPRLGTNPGEIFQDIKTDIQGTILKVEDASIWIGDRILFEDLNFSLRAGECVGLVGNNGVGKSTLLDSLYQYLVGVDSSNPLLSTSMKVTFMGNKPNSQPRSNAELYNLLQYLEASVPQGLGDIDLTGIIASQGYHEHVRNSSFSVDHCNVGVAYMRQNHCDGLDLEATVSELIEEVYDGYIAKQRALDFIEANSAILNEFKADDSHVNSLVAKQLLSLATLDAGKVSLKLKDLYITSKRLTNVLGLENVLNLKVSSLSGGYKVRVYLLLMFLHAPKLLLLDEPTNNLDAPSISFLANALQLLVQQNGLSILMVSHDPEFLNLCNTIFQAAGDGTISPFKGDFDKFVVKAKDKSTQKASKLEKLRANLRRLTKDYQETFNSTKGTERARKITLTQKQQLIDECKDSIEALEGLERNLYSKLYEDHLFRTSDDGSTDTASTPINIQRLLHSPLLKHGDFDPISKSTFALRNATVQTNDGNRIFSGLDLPFYAGERLVLLGNNGSGKSTLINLLRYMAGDAADLGHLNVIGGSLDYPKNIDGAAKTVIGYYAQNCATLLDCHETVLQTAISTGGCSSVQDVCTYLACFHLSDFLDTRVSALSFGEKSRLLMALLFLRKSHILLLDEPSNHLDFCMHTILTTLLNDVYVGGWVLATHDLKLLEALRIDSFVYIYSHNSVFSFNSSFGRHYIDFIRSGEPDMLGFLESMQHLERSTGPSMRAMSTPIQTAHDAERIAKRGKRFGGGGLGKGKKMKNAKRWE